MQYKSYILTIAGVFVEQPGPESVVFAAVGTRVQFTCSVDDSYSADWRVTLPNVNNSIDTDGRSAESFLNQRNITVNGLETPMSNISLDATNNQTSLACLVIDKTQTRILGHTFEVIFYGKL